MVKMKEVARSHGWWETIDRDIETFVRQCVSCQQTWPVPTAAPLTPEMWPGKSWHRVNADFTTKEGLDFLVIVDAHSNCKWLGILPMFLTAAAATIAVFRDVFARFSFPVNVVTDNGPQFISVEFSEFFRRNGVKHIRVAPYHPASNGAAERMVQSFKRSVEAPACQHWSIHESPSG